MTKSVEQSSLVHTDENASDELKKRWGLKKGDTIPKPGADDIIYINSDLRAISPNEKILPRVSVEPKNPSTITAVITLNKEIDAKRVIDVMRLGYITSAQLKRYAKSNGIPLTKNAGQIIQAKSKDQIRGYCTTDELFKNSISLYMSTGNNNVQIKLSKTIHMCGARSSQMAIDMANHLIDNITSGQRMLYDIQREPDRSSITKKLILRLTKMQKFRFSGPKIVTIDRTVLLSLLTIIDNWRCDKTMNFAQRLIESDDKKIATMCRSYFKLDELYQVNPDLLEFLIEHAFDSKSNYNKFVQTIERLYSITDEIVPGGLKVATIKPAMVNLTYNVGYEIKLSTLCKIIENTNLPCRARYNPQYDTKLTIFFPCEIEGRCQQMKEALNEHGEIEVDDRDMKCCTVTITSTGSIHQSNPTERLARDVHVLLMSIMTLIRDQVDVNYVCRRP